MFEHMNYHLAPWGVELAIYFFLIGLAAATFVLAAAPRVFGGAARAFEPVQRPATAVAIVVAAVCVPLLIADLGQPQRFLYPILYFHPSSPLSWGTLLVPLFILAMVVYFWALWRENERLAKIAGVVGSLLALTMPVYTAIDLMANQAREVWHSGIMPPLFIALSVTSGAAVVAILLALRGGSEGAPRLLRRVLLFSIGATGVMFFSETVALRYGSAEEQLAWQVITEEMAASWWGLTLLVGIVAPLALLLVPGLRRQMPVIALAGVLGAVGAFTFRQVLLYAGQLPLIYY